MVIMNKLFYFFVACSIAMTLTGCSKDDDYDSKVPTFSDIVFDKDILYTDQQVVATAVQTKTGKLLDRAEYRWYGNMYNPVDSTMRYTNALMYPTNHTNPACTFRTPSNPGSYSIVFHGIYNISGQAGSSEKVVNNGKASITYQYTPLKGYVTITKSFLVKRR